MSECIISRRGYGVDGKMELKTQTFTGNATFTMPNHKGPVSVRIFGGGSGTPFHVGEGMEGGSGGGGGWMNNGEFDIPNGSSIPIIIGRGGICEYANSAGGTSSFGMYLSANGGGLGGSGSGGVSNYYDYGSTKQFGGGACREGGGNGGIWGGGAGGSVDFNRSEPICHVGGCGGTYGGGGGGAASNYYIRTAWKLAQAENGGNGGTYGGGGGGGIGVFPKNNDADMQFRANGGSGGEYGGNGGNNGIDTSTWTNVDMLNGKYLRGTGGSGSNSSVCVYPKGNYKNVYNGIPGGGGFGGRGGSTWRGGVPGGRYDTYTVLIAGGGGGGYGGNGGQGWFGQWNKGGTGEIGASGGGGGGYGSNGGRGNNIRLHWSTYGGGGGGYGPGADGHWMGGGGGYFCPGNGLGGGGYTGHYGSGGNGAQNNGNGREGICIVQYYG